ncbi:sugar ABC transporter substrate-binding protein, partial [Brachybacterium alimentarium]|uniref:sugar ABC transporter substrate-binding protein n=1 Tax=Brachybacterium alimentarium TaxID=47845 RepID=UPI003FD60602
MRRSTTGAAALVLAALLTLCACSSNGTGSGDRGDDTPTIGFVHPTLNNPYFVRQSEGADAAGEEFGGEVINASGENNVATQVQQIEDFVSQGVDAIIVQAVDTKGVVASVNEAIAADIPVFTTGERLEGADVTTAVFFDNLESGALGGQWISDNYDEGDVLELQGILGTETATQKSEGLATGLERGTNGDDFEIVASQPANYDRAEALTVTENVLQSKNVDVVYASNDEMALGAAQAVEEAGLTGDVAIV